jgi:hypothetical protein
MKLTLAEFKSFSDALPPGWYFEGDEGFIPDELWDDGIYDPTEVIDVKKFDISILWEGDGDPPVGTFDGCLDFITEFKKWEKKSTDEIVSVTVPKERYAEFKEYVTQIGGKVAEAKKGGLNYG